MVATEQLEVIDQVDAGGGTIVEVVQYPALRGSADVRTAEGLYFAGESGMHMKMVRIRLAQSHVRVEPGALYFMSGSLEMKASTVGGIAKALARSVLSGETLLVNEIHGSGEIYLEPTFGHFILHRLMAGEGGIIVDKGMFFAGTAGLDIGAARQKNVSSALFGGEGLVQTRYQRRRRGRALFACAPREIMRIDLKGDKLWVDGNFALMRSEGIAFRAEKSSKRLLSTLVSGEGILQTFEGHGSVWIAPTQGIYEKLARAQGLEGLTGAPGSSNTATHTK